MKKLVAITEEIRAQILASAVARICLTGEAAASEDSRYVPAFLALVAAAFSQPSPKLYAKFGAYGPAGVIDENDVLYTNYLEPGPEDQPSVIHTMWRVGPTMEVVDVLASFAEVSGLSDAEAQGALNMVFQHWVKVDKVRDPASVVTMAEVINATKFALKPGEKEKTEAEREKDGY